MKVLFVCTANICRSAMAAEYLRHRLARSGLSHVVVDSAGLLGIQDCPASPESVRVLHEHGLDLSRHRSKGVSGVDMKTTDLVVAMTLDHLHELEARFPDQREQRELLRAFEKHAEPQSGAPDLTDPIGESVEFYRDCFDTIRTCMDHLSLHLKHVR